MNDNTTLITYEIDVMQTWFIQNGSIRPCMVLREHVNDDTFGTNLEAEPVGSDVYDYDEIVKSGWFNNYDVILSASSEPQNSFKYGLYCGTDLVNIPCANQTQADVITSKILTLLGSWDKNQQSADIVDLYTFPREFADASTYDNPRDIQVNHPNNFDSYSPKNNKMYAYPFAFLFATTQNGDSELYRWEYWDGNNLGGSVHFGAYGNPLGGGMIMCYPKAYNGIAEDFDMSLVISDFPKNSANIDAYQAWVAAGGQTRLNNAKDITQNRNGAIVANAIGTGMEQVTKGTTDVIKGAVETATGAGAIVGVPNIVKGVSSYAHAAGTAMNAYADVKEANYKIDYAFKDVQYVPNIVVGKNTPCIGVANHTLEFYFYHAHVRADEAKRIDDFLTMYGYSINRIKAPNLTGRQYWNFVKTENAVIAGDMPASSKEAIARIFDGGITFWHNGDNVGNYLISTSQGTANNPII